MNNGNKPAFISDNSVYNCSGLTKREYIATACLQGLLSEGDNILGANKAERKLSDIAITYADELLKELEKPDA